MTSFDPVVTIILTTWNSSANLPRCLNALATQTWKDFEIIIVDNASTDGAVDHLEEKYPGLDLHIKRLESNQGFASANNLGANHARGNWLVLLNSDAFPEPYWLQEILQAAEKNPEYSCFSSRQVQAADARYLDGAGDAYHITGLAWRRFMGYPAEKFGLESAEVFSPCAAAALYKREAFLEVGGFDEDFFAYFEDVDLGFRLRLYGYRTLYVPGAVVQHVGSATFGQRSGFAFYHVHRNLVWTFFKDMPAFMLWKYLPAHLLANVVYLAYYFIRAPGIGIAILRGKLDALKELNRVLQKRKEIQRHRKVSVKDLEHVMDHGLLQPYLLSVNLRRVLRDYSKLENK